MVDVLGCESAIGQLLSGQSWVSGDGSCFRWWLVGLEACDAFRRTRILCDLPWRILVHQQSDRVRDQHPMVRKRATSRTHSSVAAAEERNSTVSLTL